MPWQTESQNTLLIGLTSHLNFCNFLSLLVCWKWLLSLWILWPSQSLSRSDLTQVLNAPKQLPFDNSLWPYIPPLFTFDKQHIYHTLRRRQKEATWGGRPHDPGTLACSLPSFSYHNTPVTCSVTLLPVTPWPKLHSKANLLKSNQRAADPMHRRIGW